VKDSTDGKSDAIDALEACRPPDGAVCDLVTQCGCHTGQTCDADDKGTLIAGAPVAVTGAVLWLAAPRTRSMSACAQLGLTWGRPL
jgi:hypothetical protein